MSRLNGTCDGALKPCSLVLKFFYSSSCRAVGRSENSKGQIMLIPFSLPSGFSDLPTALRRKRSRRTLDHESRVLGLNLFPLIASGFHQKPLRFRWPCSSSLLLPKWGYLLVNNNNKLEKVLTDCCQQILGFKRLFLLELCKKENNEFMVREFRALHKYLINVS